MALNILYGTRQEWGVGLSGVTQEANDALYPISGRLIDWM